MIKKDLGKIMVKVNCRSWENAKCDIKTLRKWEGDASELGVKNIYTYGTKIFSQVVT